MDTFDNECPKSRFSKTKELYSTPNAPGAFNTKALDFFVQGFVSTNEDWNSRRLRYNVKKYGNIKAEKLASSEFGNKAPITDSDFFHTPSLRRQLSLMTQIGTPAPFSPDGVSTYRNSAIRTLSYLFINSAFRRSRTNHTNETEPTIGSPSEPTVIKLPAGTIVSSPIAPYDPNSASIWRESVLKPVEESKSPSVHSIEKAWRSVSCFPTTVSPKRADSRYHSCHELNLLPHRSTIVRPVHLPANERRIFFPSSHHSQQFKSPDQPIAAFPDMAKDFDLECALGTGDALATNGVDPDIVESKISSVSRLSLLRPPPLDLRLQLDEAIQPPPDKVDGQILRHIERTRVCEMESDISSPYVIRPRVHNNSSTPISPFTPLVLSHRDSRNACPEDGQVITDRRKRQTRQKWFTRYFQRNQQTDAIYRQVNDAMLDYRPYFTYMLCFIHILVMVLACVGYGFTSVGINLERVVTKQLMMPSLSVENVCRVQDENIWIGPQQADLIRMGARYSPCMRPDTTLRRVVVEAQNDWDRHSGCCIRNEGDVCYQTSRLFCSRSTSSWLHHTHGASNSLVAQALFDPEMHNKFPGGDVLPLENLTSNEVATLTAYSMELGSGGRVGPVCGLDPEFCEEPRSTGPFTWSPTDVTEWPVCTKPVNASYLGNYAQHMQCEVVARPCCVGLKGECILTTMEHCAFLDGRFHRDARLCSQRIEERGHGQNRLETCPDFIQIHCLQEVCGMVPFVNPTRPDQISRILISLFLHAGIVHLVFSLFIQLTVMRHLEKLLGCVRVSVIFLLSGCFSGLASGIMLPYHVHTGPTGAHFALFGVSLIDSLQALDIFVSPLSVILKQAVFLVIGVFVGFLPWLDNYAHISGFISGVLLAYVFVPYLGYGNKNQLRMIRISSMSQHAAVGDADRTLYENKIQDLIRRMRRRKVKVIVGCLTTWIGLFILLITVFINWPLTNCTWCKFLNCLPLTPNLCDTLEVNVHAPTRCINPRA